MRPMKRIQFREKEDMPQTEVEDVRQKVRRPLKRMSHYAGNMLVRRR